MKKKNLLCAILMAVPFTFLQAQFVDFEPWQTFDGNYGAGIQVEDYDGDGWEDILILNGSTSGFLSNTLYRNTGSGFEDVSTTILPAHSGRYNAGAFADFNGDGHKDLYLAAWNLNTLMNTENLLLAGDGDGGFTEVDAGPPSIEQHSTAGCSWADINGDGWVDIFLANLSTSFGSAPNALYTNQGNGTFQANPGNILVTDISLFTFSGNWADVDGDRDPDLYAANAFATDQLYYNDGAGNFTPNTDEVLFNQNMDITYRAAWADYDNDGDLDFFAPSDHQNHLYENDGQGHFSQKAGSWEEEDDDTAAAAWADFDNDGDLDLLLTSFYNNHNTLFRNDGGTLNREESAMIPILDGFSGIADFNNDGFQDVAVANGGFPDTEPHTAVFLNQGNNNHWVQFTLKGNAPNTMAIGAVVRVKATINGQETWQMRQVASSSHESGSSRLHFGLGDAADIDEIIIEWPDGVVEACEGFMVDEIHNIEQENNQMCRIVGLDDKNRLPGKLTLTPNPARESTLLQLETEEPLTRCTISLLHLTGQAAWSEKQLLNGATLNREINLQSLPAGLYYVQIEAEGRRIIRNLVITP